MPELNYVMPIVEEEEINLEKETELIESIQRVVDEVVKFD